MKKFIVALGLLSACGLEPQGEKETVYRDVPAPPTPGPGPTPQPVGFAKIRPLLEESCGFNGCHSKQAGFITTEAGLRASTAKTRIINGSMPPTYSQNYYLWEDGTRKKTILDFLNRTDN